MKDRTSFEVQVLRDKRWVLEDVKADEASAVAFADQLAQKASHSAVRVVRDFKRADGLHVEKVLVEKSAAAPTKAELSVAPVGEAPLCRQWQEGYGLPARLVIGRVFRRYLDEVLITPTELLHNGREMKRLADKDRLLMSAVDQVASLQAPEGGEAAKARRDFLHRGWEMIAQRAQRLALPKPAANASLETLLAAAGGGEDAAFRLAALLALQLLDRRGWLAKLDQVLRWAAEPCAATQMVLIDGLIADLLIPASAIQDLLGFQPNLGLALARIMALASGQAGGNADAEAFASLNRLFAEGKLPQSREALHNRVARELRSANPLARNEPSREYETFVALVTPLLTNQGVVGGAAMADALTQRYIRFHNMGGVAGLLYAIDEIEALLGDRSRVCLYLAALLEVPRLAESQGPLLLRKLEQFSRPPFAIGDWVPAKQSAPERMAALTGCHRAILAAPALPDALRTALAAACDTVLAQYLLDEQVIEKIDRPEDPLAFRALRLVKFCASGALIAGKSLELAHKRVLGHLRQAQFEEKFLASIPDQSQAERHLREFHKLLTLSGFKG